MGVRFLIGRAGTGKSTVCAREIRAEMARDAFGGSLLWITPEQGTFTAERLLFASSQKSEVRSQKGVGAFRAQVVSFRRLAAMIGREVGFLESTDAKPLGDLARIVLLEETVRGVRDQLQVFGGVADRAGFVEKLDGMLRELRQHGQTAETIRAVSVQSGVDPLTARKLEDLAIVSEAWSRVMEGNAAAGAGLWDFEKIMLHAALRVGESPLIAGDGRVGPARIWVDGFSAMSALEIRLLGALAERAEEVTVTLLADPESAAIRELRCSPEEMGLFARTERLYCRLVDAFGKLRVRVEGTTGLKAAHRFAAPALARVEAKLFSTNGTAAKSNVRAETGDLFGARGAAVEVWECSDPETEVRIAAQAIREWAVGGGGDSLRYREVGVIVPDLEGYQDAIARIFSEHGIPFFIDQRRSIAHHPLVELLRSAVAIEMSRWDQDDVLLYLKTGLAGVNEADVALVENYVIGHGITRMGWSEEWRWVAPNQKEEDAEYVPEHARAMLLQVNAVREKVWKDWSSARAAMQETSEGAAGHVRWLRGLLDGLAVRETMERWIAATQAKKDAELAQIHEQVWRQVEELLGMLEGLLRGRERTLAEFAGILEGALETLTLGLIPPTVDQVLVSSVTRSRVPELRVCVVLGAVEGQFPKIEQEDAILSDAQRDFFNMHSGEPIGEGSEKRLMEMPFFDYTALTRASERLIVSYPVADRRGRAVSRSRYVQRLQELLGDELVVRKFDVGSRTRVEGIGTMDDLLAGVVTWTREMLRRRETVAEGSQDGVMRGLYNWLCGMAEPGVAAARELVWRAVVERGSPQLAQDLAERFYPPARDLRMSVSQLEKFAACPLQYFMHYTLGLRPRAMLEMDTLNLGVLYHRVLEKVYVKIIAGELDWPDCDARNLRRVLEEEVDAACEELHAELAERTPAYEKMKARTKRVLGIVLEGQRRRACAGDMRPIGVEVSFGGNTRRDGRGVEKIAGARVVNLPVLRIGTPEGHAVELNGKIDRVDASEEGRGRKVAVIDYKSASEKKLEMYLVYWGLALQLPVYAVVMEALADREAMAALYVPLGLKRGSVKRLADAPEADSDAFYQMRSPRGVVDAESAWHLDAAVAPHEDAGVLSDWFSIGFNKKDGAIPKRGDMIAHEDFRVMLEYVRWKIGRMVDDLMRGQIAPAPYRDKQQVPCEECDFASLCPFDRVNGTYRDVPKLKREEAIGRMREAVGGGGVKFRI